MPSATTHTTPVYFPEPSCCRTGRGTLHEQHSEGTTVPQPTNTRPHTPQRPPLPLSSKAKKEGTLRHNLPIYTSGHGRRKPTDGPGQFAVLTHLNIAATIFSPSPTYFCCTAPMRTLMNVAPDCFAMACGRSAGAVQGSQVEGSRGHVLGQGYLFVLHI